MGALGLHRLLLVVVIATSIYYISSPDPQRPHVIPHWHSFDKRASATRSLLTALCERATFLTFATSHNVGPLAALPLRAPKGPYG